MKQQKKLQVQSGIPYGYLLWAKELISAGCNGQEQELGLWLKTPGLIGFICVQYPG